MITIGNITYIAGKITEITNGKGKAESILTTLTLEVIESVTDIINGEFKTIRKPQYYKCEFWNSGKSLKSDWLRNSKTMKIGKYCIISGYINVANDHLLTVRDFGIPGKTFIHEQNEKKYTIVLNYVGGLYDISKEEKKMLKVSVQTQELGWANAHWTSLTYMNYKDNDKDINIRNYDKAARVLSKGDLCMFMTTEIKSYEYENKTMYSCFGNMFEVVKYKSEY